ncbi:MAG: hypothetical protein HYU36_11835 [Planctomycetes bacterium]|nr:hypothetical protein [Planctomycetota bacterium]
MSFRQHFIWTQLFLYTWSVAAQPILHLALHHDGQEPCLACEQGMDGGPSAAADCGSNGPCGDPAHHHHRRGVIPHDDARCPTCAKLLSPDSAASAPTSSGTPDPTCRSVRHEILLPAAFTLEGVLPARGPPA